MNPATMYRGVASNMVNMGGCTMIQFATGGFFKSKVLAGESRQMTKVEEIGCGLGAGMISATWGTPLELFMIQQQRKGGNTLDTAKKALSGGYIGRGFLGCAGREVSRAEKRAAREIKFIELILTQAAAGTFRAPSRHARTKGLWTVGYMSIPPIVRRSLRESFPDTFTSDDLARVPASLLGGLFACYLTQPMDTIKTCMQGDVEKKTFKSFLDTAKVLNAESGIQGFYRGATFRCV